MGETDRKEGTMIITYHGISRDHKAWAAFLGITEQTMRWRVKHWGVERAVSLVKSGTPGSSKRRPASNRNLSVADKERAVSAYLRDESEDDIAANIGISRRLLSELLIGWGIKRKGAAPKRIAGTTAKVHISKHQVTITIRGPGK